MEKFKRGFSTSWPDPRADRRTARVAGGFVHCSCGDTVWRRAAPRTWPRLGNPRKGCCGWSCSCEHGVPSHDTFSGSLLGPAGVRGRIPPVHGRLRQGNGLEPRGVVCGGWQSLARAFERGRQTAPRCTMVNVGQRRRECAWLSAKLAGRNEAAGALEVLGLLDLEGCIVTADALQLPSRLCLHGARAGCGLRAGAQGEPEQVVRCGRSALCAQRSPQRCRTAQNPPLTIAASGGARPCLRRYHFRRGPEVDPGVVALAGASARTRREARCRAEPPHRAVPALALAKPAMNRRNAASNACGSSRRRPKAQAAHSCCSASIIRSSSSNSLRMRARPLGASRTAAMGTRMSSSTRIATELAKTRRVPENLAYPPEISSIRSPALAGRGWAGGIVAVGGLQVRETTTTAISPPSPTRGEGADRRCRS